MQFDKELISNSSALSSGSLRMMLLHLKLPFKAINAKLILWVMHWFNNNQYLSHI